MTVNIVPVNAYGATLPIPADGEPANSASIAQYVQEIANRLEYLRQRTPGANPPANLIRVIIPIVESAQGTGWTYGRSTNGTQLLSPYLQNSDVALQRECAVQVPWLPVGIIIRAFGCVMQAATTHAALPANMPTLSLCAYSIAAGYVGAAAEPFGPPETIIDSQIDTSPNIAAYNIGHVVSKSLTKIVAAGEFYQIKWRNESGANSQTGNTIRSFYIDISGT